MYEVRFEVARVERPSGLPRGSEKKRISFPTGREAFAYVDAVLDTYPAYVPEEGVLYALDRMEVFRDGCLVMCQTNVRE